MNSATEKEKCVLMANFFLCSISKVRGQEIVNQYYVKLRMGTGTFKKSELVVASYSTGLLEIVCVDLV